MQTRVLRPLMAVLAAAILVASQVGTVLASNFRVVIDPGHGGKDPGATSAFLAATEKEVALRLAMLTGAALQRRGVSVIFTRTGDRDVSLEERAALAQRVGAHALVSLHLNAAANPHASGAEAWYGSGERHADLAGFLLDAIAGPLRAHGMAVRGTRSGPNLAVLRTPIPATLLELGYVTNASDARVLAQDPFLASVAEALADGLVRFRDLRPQNRSVVAASIGLPTTGFHFVRLGDTLASIAAQIGIPVSEILNLNPTVQPQVLHVGQPVQLRSPAEGPSAPRLSPSATAMLAGNRPPSGTTGGAGVHTVAPGETLSEIALRHRRSTAELVQWNGIADPDRVTAGQTLLVAPPSAGGDRGAVLDPNSRYVVQEGDTLFSIARRWNVPLEALRQHNRIPDPSLIRPGTVLERPKVT
jgi:N-acetylmuramoyl-L-alanine amidase/LysM repeat protein